MAIPTTTAPAAPATAPAATQQPNTALFAKPGESFSNYEARVSGGSSGNAGGGASPAGPAAPTVSLPNGNTPTGDSGITPNQYAKLAGETDDAYNARIAGLRNAGGVATPATNPTDIVSAEDKVAQSLGYKSYADAESALSAPTQNETDLYNSAYSSAGLDDLASKIAARQNDLNVASGNINDNPWLSEASRTGRLRTLTDLANGDIKNWQNEYNTKLKSVHDLVTREAADNTTSSKANATKLAALEAQAKQIASENIASAKTAAAPPKTITGGATGATYKWNPTSQQFEEILPGKTKTTSSSSSGGSKGPVPPASATGTGSQFNNFNYSAKQLGDLNAKGLNQDHANTILNEIKQGYTLDDIRQQMQASSLDPGLLDTIMYYVDPAHNTPVKTSKTSSSSSGGRSL